MRKFILVLMTTVALLLSGAQGSFAHHYQGHTKGKKASDSPSVSKSVLETHNEVCPQVSEYTNCSTLRVEIANYGATGWNGSASPANGLVRYNTYYANSNWAQVVSHEVGGHVDAWNEIVAKVGVSQAWVDYYDLDHFAVQWLYGHTGTTYSTTRAKEMYLDCAGPVAHGYWGNYVGSLASKVCPDHESVMQMALTGSQ